MGVRKDGLGSCSEWCSTARQSTSRPRPWGSPRQLLVVRAGWRPVATRHSRHSPARSCRWLARTSLWLPCWECVCLLGRRASDGAGRGVRVGGARQLRACPSWGVQSQRLRSERCACLHAPTERARCRRRKESGGAMAVLQTGASWVSGGCAKAMQWMRWLLGHGWRVVRSCCAREGRKSPERDELQFGLVSPRWAKQINDLTVAVHGSNARASALQPSNRESSSHQTVAA